MRSLSGEEGGAPGCANAVELGGIGNAMVQQGSAGGNRRQSRVRITRVLPGLDVAAIRHYCEQHVPPHAIDVLRTEVELTPGAATILECRAPWREDFGPDWTKRGVARLRYTIKSGLWTLYYSDRNGRWHLYDLIGPTKDIRILLDEVDRDPTCIFWG